MIKEVFLYDKHSDSGAGGVNVTLKVDKDTLGRNHLIQNIDGQSIDVTQLEADWKQLSGTRDNRTDLQDTAVAVTAAKAGLTEDQVRQALKEGKEVRYTAKSGK